MLDIARRIESIGKRQCSTVASDINKSELKHEHIALSQQPIPKGLMNGTFALQLSLALMHADDIYYNQSANLQM